MERISPGRMYKSIIIERMEPEKREVSSTKKLPWFVRFCKSVYNKHPGLAGKVSISEQHKAALSFMNWDLSPQEFTSGVNVILLISIFSSFAAWLLLSYLDVFSLVPIAYFNYFALALLLLAALSVFRYFYMYPITMANIEQKRALGYIPEIVGYMTMSLKLTPNLEKAVEFAANHGSGKIANEFKKLLWDVEVGIYTTVAEGLDEIAYRWGLFAPEFKRALMRIRASILEDSEAKRDALLNRTMDELLQSIREKMEEFATSIKQPSVALFFTGILLPLILMVILPVGSVFSGFAIGSSLVMFLIYNVAIPGTVFFTARSIIKRRPPTRELPEIKASFLGLKSEWHAHIAGKEIDVRILAFGVLFLGILISYVLHTYGIHIRLLNYDFWILKPDRTLESVLDERGLARNYFDIPNGALYQQYYAMYYERYKSAKKAKELAEAKVIVEKKRFFMRRENDVTPYVLYSGLMLTFALTIFVLFYYREKEKFEKQKEILEMESEFKDAIYIIASRLGEHKPMEEAIRYVDEFLPKSAIGKFFKKIRDNIAILGMPLENAVFDSRFGALVGIPSKIIRSAMRIVIDASKLGTTIAARTLVALSLQLDNMEKVEKMLKSLISDIMVTMRTLAIIIAPIVLGITTALYKVVVVTIANISSQSSTIAEVSITENINLPEGYSNLSEIVKPISKVRKRMLQPEALAGLTDPTTFIAITAIYLIEIVAIITYFASIIEENNKLKFRIEFAKYMMIAILIYTAVLLATNYAVGVMLSA